MPLDVPRPGGLPTGDAFCRFSCPILGDFSVVMPTFWFINIHGISENYQQWGDLLFSGSGQDKNTIR